MLFRMIYDDVLAQAAYLIGCQRTGEAILIDPERDVDRYLRLALAEKVRITAVTETHIHADFLSGIRQVAEQTGAKVYASDAGGADWKYQWLDQKIGCGLYSHEPLHDGSVSCAGAIQCKAVHTPGHTPEHLAFPVSDRGGGATEPKGIATGACVCVGDPRRPTSRSRRARRLQASARLRRTALSSPTARLPQVGLGTRAAPAQRRGGAQSTVGEKRFNAFCLPPDEPGYVLHPRRPARAAAVLARIAARTRLAPPCSRDARAAELGLHDLGTPIRRRSLVDTRPWSHFRAGHLPEALHAPGDQLRRGRLYSNRRRDLLAPSRRADEAVRCLIRIA